MSCLTTCAVKALSGLGTRTRSANELFIWGEDMSINQEKFSNLNKARKATHKQVVSNLSQLLAYSMDAIKQQCYMHENPDDNRADELIAVVTPDFIEASKMFNDVKGRLEDLQSVASGSMTTAEMKTKYSVDLIEYSEELN